MRSSHPQLSTHQMLDEGPEALVRFLKEGGDPNAPAEGTHTPLVVTALATGADPSLLDILFRHGARLPQNVGHHMAGMVHRGNSYALRIYLTHGASPNETDDQCPLLVIAAEQGRMDMVEMLLGAGATVDKPDENGMTALMCAAAEGNEAMVHALMGRGANANSMSVRRDFPFKIALEQWRHAPIKDRARFTRVMDALLPYTRHQLTDDQGRTPLFLCVEAGYERGVDHFLAQGAQIHSPERSAYHMAAGRENSRILQQIIARVDDVRLVNKKGESALHVAARTGMTHHCKTLVDAGVDVNHVDYFGYKAVDHAAAHGNGDTFDALVSLGTRCSDHKLLHHAAEGGNPLIAKRVMDLLGPGAVNAADPKTGNTPLLVAAAYGNADVAVALIERGADIDATDAGGRDLFALGNEEVRERVRACLANEQAQHLNHHTRRSARTTPPRRI